MGQFITSPIASQGMLFPYEWEMKKDEKTIWESNALLLKQLGLVWEFEKENMTLSSIPSILPEDGIPAFIQMLLEQMMMEQIDKGEIAHHFVLSLSKAASMKKKLILSNENASDLVQSLFGCKEHVYSPSGKLILKTITFEQLEN